MEERAALEAQLAEVKPRPFAPDEYVLEARLWLEVVIDRVVIHGGQAARVRSWPGRDHPALIRLRRSASVGHAPAMTSVLMVLSAAQHWTLNDGTLHPTGFWAEEFVVPYEVFTAAGWDVTVATLGGKTPIVDRLSLGISGGLPHKTKRIEAKLDELAPVLAHPANLSDVDGQDFDVVFYSGGHAPMEDLAVDETSGALLTKRLASGRPLALLCHAPAAALAARNPDGSWPFAGYQMTGLSNREERLNRFAWKAKWLLEDRLKEGGAQYSKGLPLRSHIVVDRGLYTGQNPAHHPPLRVASSLTSRGKAASSSGTANPALASTTG